MAKLGSWSTTSGSNNSTPPDGWPEGQAPSTVNDCAREMMARIREVFNDVQYFDQNLTPTFINATSFSVVGDQTSAIVAGRRLKIFDATAGVATAIYATVLTASFTVVTTVSISADGGQLTSSLSSFAMSIISPNNSALPRALGVGSVSAENVYVSGALTASGATSLLTTLSVSGATVLGATLSLSGAATFNSTLTVSGATSLLTTLSVGGATVLGTTLTVGGAAVVGGALSVGGAVIMASTLAVSATVDSQQVTRAWVRYTLTAGGAAIINSFNVASVSRSGSAISRITFTNAFVDGNYIPIIQPVSVGAPGFTIQSVSQVAASVKFTVINHNGDPSEGLIINAVAYR